MITYLKNILQLVLAPGYAWEDISHDGRPAERLLYGGYVPIAAVAALSVFFRLIYAHHDPIGLMILLAAATFVSLFVSYFLSQVLLRSFMPGCLDGNYNDLKFNTVTIYSQSIIAFLVLLNNVLPTRLSVVYLLMIAVTLIIWKASTYLRVDADKEMKFVVVGAVSIVLPPLLLITFFYNLIA